MKHLRNSLLVLIALAITSWATLVTPAAHTLPVQAQSTALERGYRTGYSDGYNAGTRDVADHARRDYQSKDDYQHADRSYNEAWGTIEDYRDGYQQGFEAGYTAGFDRHPFDSSIPTGLAPRGTTNSGAGNTNNSSPNNSNNAGQPMGAPTAGAPVSGPVIVPRDSILVVELQSSLSTDASQRGDRFLARVVEPREFEGAIVEGRVTRVKRAGKVKGTAELQLSFETIHLPDGPTTGFNAEVVELLDTSRRQGEPTVDDEGGVKAKDSTKDNVTKIGAGAGVGAIIGAIVGGGKGAAIGAVIGAGVGTGSVLSKRGQDVRLDRGQRLKIRTATEARIP
jgi:hypothetical protein